MRDYSPDDKCALCGKKLYEPVNRDHIIPRALIKWSERYVSKGCYNFIEQHVENSSNIFWVHEKCNTIKQSCLPTLDEIKRLHFTPEERQKFNRNYKALEPYIKDFERRIHERFVAQHGRCYYCKKRLNPKAYAIRRISFKKGRVFETNGCLACYDCSAKRF